MYFMNSFLIGLQICCKILFWQDLSFFIVASNKFFWWRKEEINFSYFSSEKLLLAQIWLCGWKKEGPYAWKEIEGGIFFHSHFEHNGTRTHICR